MMFGIDHLQEVRDGEEPMQFEQALQACIIRSSDAGKGLPRYGRCTWLGGQYEVSQCLCSAQQLNQ